MRAVYTTHFLVLAEGKTTGEVFAEVRREVSKWVGETAERRTGAKVEIPANGGVSLPNGVGIHVDARGNPEASSIWILTYTHPDDERNDLRWQTTCQLATHGSAVEFSLRLAAGETLYRIAPQAIRPGRPRIVPAIIRNFSCAVGGRTLSCDPLPIPLEDVEDFIQNGLLSDSRRLPLVVVSPEARTGQLVIDPKRLADSLAGLAEVWFFEDVATTYALTDNLPPGLAVFDGGVRIYWPQMRLGDSPRRHRLFTRFDFGMLRERGVKPDSVITNLIIRTSAATHFEGAVLSAARTALLEEHTRQFTEAASKGRTAAELRPQLESALEELVQKDEIIKGLQSQLTEMEGNFLEFQRDLLTEAQAEHELPETLEETPLFRTVGEAIIHAQKKYGTVIEVWDSAIASAQESTSKHTMRVYDSLRILSVVANEYFDAKAQGKSLGGGFEKRFGELGAPKYAAKDSPTTVSKYGEERRFSQDGRTIQFEKHFTIAVNSLGGNCVQLYFHLDDARKKAIVGYCGSHLRHADRS